jgi:hypothetical protein
VLISVSFVAFGWCTSRESRLGNSLLKGVVQLDVIWLDWLEGLIRGRCYMGGIMNHLLLFYCSLSSLACTVDLVHLLMCSLTVKN